MGITKTLMRSTMPKGPVRRLAVTTFFAGWRLAQRRARPFCLWVAAVNCFFFPFGTALGIFTLVVLSRPEAREAFASASPLPNVAAWEDTTLP